MRIAKEREIYNNYDLWEKYPDDDIRECLIDQEILEEDITDDMIDNTRYRWDEDDWDTAKTELTRYFKGKRLLVFGEIGKWDGVRSGFNVFSDFMKLFYWATEDCDYIHIYDENGHLYLHCSHHDGSCSYEIKILSEKGYEYFDRWIYGSDKRSAAIVGKQLKEKYSTLPHFAHNVYGCKKIEYEDATKEKLIKKFSNVAVSRYA